MNIAQRLVQKFNDGNNSGTSSFEDVENFDPEESWFSTGSPYLDYSLSTFGYPLGIVEVRGDSQSGKTTLSLHAMKQVLLEYGDAAIVVILSSERRDNKYYAKQIGVPVDKILVHKVKSVEDVFNKIHETIRQSNLTLIEAIEEQVIDSGIKKTSDKFKKTVQEELNEFGGFRFLFVWDALGQTVSSQELAKAKDNAMKGETGQAAMASSARALGAGLRSVVGYTDEEELTLYIINRPYDVIGGNVPSKKSYGGKAIELYPCMRLELARTGGVKVGTEEVGQRTQVKVIKSDFGQVKHKYEIEIGYGLGIVLSDGDFDMGKKAGILEKNGHGYTFKMGKKELSWSSRAELYDLYRERDPMLKVLISQLTKHAHDLVQQERKDIEDKWK